MFWTNFRIRARSRKKCFSREYFFSPCVLVGGGNFLRWLKPMADATPISRGLLDPVLSLINVVCHTTRWCARFHKSMRRVVASFVLCIATWSLVAPLALVAAGDSTPACCRRDGKHRCMMAMSGFVSNSDGNAVFRNKPADCPYRANPAQLTHPKSALPIAAVSMWLSSTHERHSETCPHRLLYRRLLKPSRGPPFPLLSNL